MALMVEQAGGSEEYEAVALPPGPAGDVGSAVFLRRSARPSRRAVLHLHDLAGSFAPPDLVRWYNERGFHFYVTDLDLHEPVGSLAGRRSGKALQSAFATLDGACKHLREADGIDAIILSAQEAAATPAALWCDRRTSPGAGRPVDALILAGPDFGRTARGRLDIGCPVLVISAPPEDGGSRRDRRGRDSVRLGQHVTWLYLEAPRDDRAGDEVARRRLFDEMGRWLGAYMYGQVRDQLL